MDIKPLLSLRNLVRYLHRLVQEKWLWRRKTVPQEAECVENGRLSQQVFKESLQKLNNQSWYVRKIRDFEKDQPNSGCRWNAISTSEISETKNISVVPRFSFLCKIITTFTHSIITRANQKLNHKVLPSLLLLTKSYLTKIMHITTH